jgi:FdhD protein
MFRETGGNHGVALFDAEGNICQVREDVGRHNAMDKLVGFCMKQNWLPLQQKGILVSGRASFELMQKALMAGCPMLVAVGAPSSLAVELAEEFNMSLLGFLSAEGYNLYHGNSPV